MEEIIRIRCCEEGARVFERVSEDHATRNKKRDSRRKTERISGFEEDADATNRKRDRRKTGTLVAGVSCSALPSSLSDCCAANLRKEPRGVPSLNFTRVENRKSTEASLAPVKHTHAVNMQFFRSLFLYVFSTLAILMWSPTPA